MSIPIVSKIRQNKKVLPCGLTVGTKLKSRGGYFCEICTWEQYIQYWDMYIDEVEYMFKDYFPIIDDTGECDYSGIIDLEGDDPWYEVIQ